MAVTIITDGSACNSTGKGGWACVVRNSITLAELTGWAEDTTSNRMELTAAVEGLKFVSIPSEITVVTDSAYLLNTMRHHWYERWFAEEGKTKPRPNLDLWYELVGLSSYHDISWIKVKGHSGDYWNDRVDKLADYARREKVTINTEFKFEGIQCNGMSYGKQCYLYETHSGDCKFGNLARFTNGLIDLKT